MCVLADAIGFDRPDPGRRRKKKNHFTKETSKKGTNEPPYTVMCVRVCVCMYGCMCMCVHFAKVVTSPAPHIPIYDGRACVCVYMCVSTLDPNDGTHSAKA